MMSTQASAGTAVSPTVSSVGGPTARPAGTGVGPVRVRPVAPGDRQALTQMFARCSAGTRYRRFPVPVKALPERYLADALSGTPFHYALVACSSLVADPGAPDPAAEGGIVALASCRTVDEGAAELGLLIEDTWQRQGLGTRLLRDLVTYADDVGLRVLEAQLLAEQAWIAGLLRPYGSCRLRSTGGGVLNVSV